MWMHRRRKDVQVTIESAALDLRARLMNSFEVTLAEGKDRASSPWREMSSGEFPDHFSEATLAAQERDFADRGVFDVGTYRNSRKSLDTLMKIISGFHRQHSQVVLVLVPEHSRMNTRIPAEALDILQRHLRENVAQHVPVLDFRRAIDDGGMVDLAHPNRQGRLAFSRQLADALRPLLPEAGTPRANRSQASGASFVAIQ
jgi:hypothetical protein